MGMRTQGGRKNRGKYQLNSEINVTPFVDVMLVLLIIFMVAAPILTSSVNLNLPKTSSNPTQQQVKPISVSLTKEGKIFVGDEAVSKDSLAAQLKRKMDKPDSPIIIRGDKDISYQFLSEILSILSKNALTKLSLVSEFKE